MDPIYILIEEFVEDRDSLSYVLENHPEITEEDEHNKFKLNV